MKHKDVQNLQGNQEANKKTIFHTADATLEGPMEFQVQSSDIDVFVLAIRWYPELCANWSFVSGWAQSHSDYYHLRSTMKRERFFRGGLLFKRDSFPDNCIDWTNENVSSGPRNYECLSQKCSTFWSRVGQVGQN